MYIVMRNKEVDMLELGTKIIGDFGAMIPLREGEVANRSYRGRRVIINKEVTDYMVKVKWDDGDYTWLDASEINAAVGKLSPIGYYTEEAYYA
jgi:hypothetical protein